MGTENVREFENAPGTYSSFKIRRCVRALPCKHS
jgi:hypothetical protein